MTVFVSLFDRQDNRHFLATDLGQGLSINTREAEGERNRIVPATEGHSPAVQRSALKIEPNVVTEYV